jgi:adenine-specific DNA-methyltransferase
LDGLLIKSENWQALNLLLNKFKEKVQTIYIDPPYNTGKDEFLYRDKYRHSSWLTMMENRLRLAKEILEERGNIFISIDDNELKNLTSLSQSIGYSIIANLIRKSGIAPRQDVKYIATEHDYVLCLAKNINKVNINKQMAELGRGYPYEDEFLAERGRFTLNKLDRGSIHYSENMDYPITLSKGTIIDVLKRNNIEQTILDEDIEIWPGGDPEDRQWTWRWSKEKFKWGMQNKMIVFKKIGTKWAVYFKQYQLVDNNLEPIERRNPYRSLILTFTNEIGNKEIRNLFGNLTFPSHPKPVPLIQRLLQIGATKNVYVLDFFAGSGTTAQAVMKLNKEDGGQRKFILIEIADYFDTVIIKRIKKVAYSFNWKDGKPQDSLGPGGFFKYQILEQYEDALDNIELKENREAMELFKDEYLLKYFLAFETRESPYLLNIDLLKNPFNYKLKVNLKEVGEPEKMIIDISETFNYLLGLKIKKIKSRKNYLFILGEKEGKSYAIVWRGWNERWREEEYIKDREFIKQELKEWKPQVVYINGQSILTPNFGDFQVELRCTETEFKKLMER